MAFSLSDVSSLIQGLTPSASDIVQNLALGAATSVVVSGIKAQMSGGALDPLGLFKQAAPANNPNAIAGATITASAFSALSAATQSQLIASGVHIVAG